MYPRLRVKLNKKLDKVICYKFINRKKAGIDFGGGIIKVHPDLKPARKAADKKVKEIINNYFDTYYNQHLLELESLAKDSQKQWDRISADFYKATDKYFFKHPWPRGKYEGYPSIIPCNPRFLDTKTFQAYWKGKKGFVGIAVHEMLHFLFYDLVEKIIPNLDVNDQKIWKLSEVFNGLLSNEPEFKKITKDKNPHQYPELIPLQDRLLKTWGKSENAENFIKSTLSSNSL